MLTGRYLQELLDIQDHLVDLEVRGHPRGIAHESQSKMMQGWMFERNELFMEGFCSN